MFRGRKSNNQNLLSVSGLKFVIVNMIDTRGLHGC